VIDTGIGISKEQTSRLFTSFEQADSSTSRKFGGTGLGLAISKRIVELMNGRVWVASELGHGSTFGFTIEMQRGSSDHHSLLETGVTWGNIRILVVDDDKETLEYFSSIMKQFGVCCDTAESGMEALDLIEKRGAYDIYFIDWKMPGINGIELTERIKAYNKGKKHVVVMISATEWSIIERDALAAGVDRFLPKPLFPSSIADCINECLGINRPETIEDVVTANDVFEGFRVLLAEDVEINREIVAALLEPTKIQIDYAENGAVAVEKFSTAPKYYDIIFMDVQMPEMDGYEATRIIRKLNNSRAKTIPIVAMTANVFREDIEHCLEAGMNDHLGKPLDMAEVIQKLHKHLRKKHSGGAK
jgi:CheY-like chemotaxis protein